VIAAGAPYFQPAINSTAGNIDDQVTLDDIAFAPAVPAAVVKYNVTGISCCAMAWPRLLMQVSSNSG